MPGPPPNLPTLLKLPTLPKYPVAVKPLWTQKPPPTSTPKQTLTPKLLPTSTSTSTMKLPPMLLPMSKPLAAGHPVPKLNTDNIWKFESAQMSAPKFSPKLVPSQPKDKNEVVYILPPGGIRSGELVELS